MRSLHKLSARTVATICEHGRHGDGGGLYLNVSSKGRRWVFLFRWHGKLTEMGLGGAAAPGKDGVTLARAREKAAEARALIRDGKNPLEAKRARQAANAPTTFGSFADQLIEAMRPGWKSPIHARQWETTLKDYAAPLRHLPLSAIGTEDVLGVLQPIWTTKNETAARVRGRIEKVLDAAKAKGLRVGENPARWRGHLDHLLPKRQKLQRGHHSAIPYAELPAFMEALRKEDSISARALEFATLTAARTGEVIGATWTEVDLQGRVWTVPAVRMKAGKEHRVPLSDRAIAILTEMLGHRRKDDDFVFPGARKGAPLSNMALSMAMRRLERTETVHGNRSTFRDWAGDETSFPREVIEAALAHSLRDDVEAAYRRSDALERRRTLMDAWSRYCEAGLKVVAIAGQRVAS
ncbi:MAG: tyrosine-type recombinase/integrase [Tabrizicola sp.]|nr:tyrosine-type recombinase/integrase [Tabrizicola sp.]